MDDSITRKPTRKRKYDSSRRAEQAAETRRRILLAAAECFSEKGYAKTTLAAIAARADVSVESVAANGAKRALLIAAFSVAYAGVETDQVLKEQQQWAAALRAPEAELAESIAEIVVESQRQGIGIWRAVSAAAIEEPEVAELYLSLAKRRRAENLAGTRILAERGLVRDDRTLEQHADTFALLNGFDPYQLYVLDFGWSLDELKAWWVDSTERLIFAPHVRQARLAKG
jgi:AcrR family transcriptional regulator